MNLELQPLFAASIIPIWAAQNEKPVQCGTGTLLRVADKRFLITAEHVTQITTRHKLQLYIADGVQGASNVALEGRLDRTTQFDVSVWELGDDIAQQLPNRTFLTTASFDRTNNRPTEGWYFVHGYPNELSSVDETASRAIAKTHTYGTIPYDGPTDNLENFNDEAHLLLAYTRDGLVTDTGETAIGPNELGGISGSSIWHAYCPGIPASNWTVDDAKIVAVQTGIYKSRNAIKSTRWWVVDRILRDRHPDLVDALNISAPSHRRSRM